MRFFLNAGRYHCHHFSHHHPFKLIPFPFPYLVEQGDPNIRFKIFFAPYLTRSSFTLALIRLFGTVNHFPLANLFSLPTTLTPALTHTTSCLRFPLTSIIPSFMAAQLSSYPTTPNFTHNTTISMLPWRYPKTRRDEACGDRLFKKFIPDPYRWLEDPESEETQKFVEDQSTLSESLINSCSYKEDLMKSLTDLYNFERYGCPFKQGNHYYYFHNSGLQAQSVLYQLSDLGATPTVFFDPNKLSSDGTIALSTYAFSENATYFAYALSKSGSDWVTIYVMKSQDGVELQDKIEYAKFTGISWTKDERGFFYTRYPAVLEKDLGTETNVNLNAQVYYHMLGTDQGKDILVFQDKENPHYRAHVMQTEDEQYLIQTITRSTAPIHLVSIAKYSNGMDLSRIPWIHVVSDWDKGSFEYIANQGSRFYFKTNYSARRYRVLQYDLNAPEKGFADVVHEHPRDTLTDVTAVHDNHMVLVYSQDVKHVLSLHRLETGEKLKNIALPTVGSVESVSGRRKYDHFFYKFTSFFNPGELFHYDAEHHKQNLFKSTHVGEGLDLKAFEAEQVFYPSKDGTSIPMFLLATKNTPKSPTTPTFLYGYGGFSISLSPCFVPTWLAFALHFGGRVAIANLRGGGEYGEEWHEAGILRQKQNGFDDFQWAAKYLVEKGYTSHAKIAINGGSNGGLLVCACINQAGPLFGAAVAEVPVLDMYRFHRFTIGHAWKADYGDPDIEEDFNVLSKYSPLHTVSAENVYPATLLMTSDHDDRVVPLHSYKYIATLQHVHGAKNPNPLMLLVERKAGHGAGKPTKKRIESAVNKLVFIGLSLKADYRPIKY